MRIVACTVDGCSSGQIARGVCPRHYYHLRRHGSADAGQRYGGNNISYDGAHKRVVSARGPARTHRCANCGALAVHWAYDNLDPAEQLSDKGYAFSLDVDHYLPLCRPCHRTADIEHRKAAAAAYRELRFGGLPSCA